MINIRNKYNIIPKIRFDFKSNDFDSYYQLIEIIKYFDKFKPSDRFLQIVSKGGRESEDFLRNYKALFLDDELLKLDGELAETGSNHDSVDVDNPYIGDINISLQHIVFNWGDHQYQFEYNKKYFYLLGKTIGDREVN